MARSHITRDQFESRGNLSDLDPVTDGISSAPRSEPHCDDTYEAHIYVTSFVSIIEGG